MRSILHRAALGAALASLAACAAHDHHHEHGDDHHDDHHDDTHAAASASEGTHVTASGQNLGRITATPVAGWDVFGGDVDGTAPIAVEALLGDPARYDGEVVVIEGEVAEACPKKGCWMTMQGGDESLRVMFKDYAFFVPIESAGRTARVEGIFSIELTPEAEARHYLEDAGKHDEAAALVGPQREYKLMATGVRMKP